LSALSAGKISTQHFSAIPEIFLILRKIYRAALLSDLLSALKHCINTLAAPSAWEVFVRLECVPEWIEPISWYHL